MDIKSIIINKRNKKELTEEEIKLFISKYNKGEVTEAQAGALINFVYEEGMTIDEITTFAAAMADSGEKIDLSEFDSMVVDEYSTGGVGDKVALILMPVIASLDIPITKIAIGNSGIFTGISNKLETIPGFSADITIDTFKEKVKFNKVGILNQSINLNPVESKMYRLKNEIACSDCIPMIAASLMSLNLCVGTKKIVFEIIYGKGTYIKTKAQAKRLAQILKIISKKFDKDVKCIVINSNEPVGYSVGHNLEMLEVINALKGNMSFDLGESIVKIGGIICGLNKQNSNVKENEKMVREVLSNGKAYEKFIEIIQAYGGDTSFIENPEKFENAQYIMPVYASKSGYISEIDSDLVGSIAWYLGAGRMNNEHDINKSAGIVLVKKVGDKIEVGEIVAYLHTNDEEKVIGAVKNLEDAFKTSKRKIIPTSRIVEIM